MLEEIKMMEEIRKNIKGEEDQETSSFESGQMWSVTNFINLRLIVKGKSPNWRWVVQVYNSRRNTGWRDFSSPFKEQCCAEGFVRGFLNPYAEFRKKTVVFLESLMHYAEDQGVQSLFTYVRDMMYYFYRCPVIDRSKVSVQFISQMDDMGDEYSDCVYGVKKELGLQDSNFDMQYTKFAATEGNSGKDVSVNSYLSTGSNYNRPLRIFWEIDLAKIKV